MEKKRKWPLIWDWFFITSNNHQKILQKSPENHQNILQKSPCFLPIFSASLADFLRDLRVDLRRPGLAMGKHVPIAVGKFQDLWIHLAERSSKNNKRRRMMCFQWFSMVCSWVSMMFSMGLYNEIITYYNNNMVFNGCQWCFLGFQWCFGVVLTVVLTVDQWLCG